MAKGRIISACALVALIACHQKKSKLDDIGVDDGAPPGVAASDRTGSAALKDAPKRAPITPEALRPSIHEIALDGRLPSAIKVEFAQPIVNGSRGTSSLSVVKINPEIPGQLSYTGPAELTFTPRGGFAFDTEYTIDLQKIETVDGVVSAPKGQPWRYTFKTPPFALVGFAPIDVQAGFGLSAEVAFTGPVLPNLAREAMTFTVDGREEQAVQVVEAHPDVLRVNIVDPRIESGSKVAVSIKNLPSAMGPKIAAKTAELTVKSERIVSIQDAVPVEGATGFYLEVVCNDSGAPAGHRYSYVGEGYYDLSERCQLDDDAIKRIHFTPEVKHTYITNGRSGFRIFGDFARGAYTVSIDSGASSVDGGTVVAPFQRSFAISARKSQLAFVGSGRYLPRTAWSNLGVKHLNVDAVTLSVRQVPPENLIFYLSDDAGDADSADERTSNLILKKTIPLRGDPDVPETTWLDVASLLPATTHGVLELRITSTDGTAVSRLLLTNISVVAKMSAAPKAPWQQKVRVWALDMDTAASLDGVEMTLVRKSGKVVSRCTTAGDDGCVLDSDHPADPDEAVPFAVIARKGDDLTYLRYADLHADVAESITSGEPYVIEAPYRAAMYSDRGVYRPGDTAHVTAIVRDAHDHAPDKPLPVDVTIVDPRAKAVRKLALKTNASGMLAIDHALPVFADTGHWRVELAVADKPLGSYDLQVEEFMPERMKVTLAPKTEAVLAGTALTWDISARYLFGGNAAASGVELSCTAEPAAFEPPANDDYTYGVQSTGKPVSFGEPAKDQLDATGNGAMACPDAKLAFTRTQKITAHASVLEAGSGRATVQTSIVTVHPAAFYIGMKTRAAEAVANEPFSVDGILVDWQGKPVTAAKEIQIQLAHFESDYGYAYDQESGEDSYDRYLRRVPDGRLTVPVDATGHFHFDAKPGFADIGFIVTATAGAAKTELVLPGRYPYDYYYGYGQDRVDRTPRPAKAAAVKLKLPKEIAVGQPASVTAIAPYPGRVLWTVETDHVVAYAWKDVKAGEVAWSFTLDTFAPNVYVSAFIVKDPHVESKAAFLPDRAYGIESVRVQPTELTQGVTIVAPKAVRSSSPLQVTLDVGAPGAFATVAVVDEGILSLTHFKTPDPLGELLARRALGVDTYETIGWTMLHDPEGASSRTGGGDDMGEGTGEGQGALAGGRVQPVKPVALFSGVVQVGADGKVTVPFQIPSYRGQVRVMAVVAGATKIGHAEADVTVRDPLVVQATFPRFLAQNDDLQVPVFLTNVSGHPLDVNVKLDSAEIAVAGLAPHKGGPAPIAILGKDTGSVHLEDGHSDTLVFHAKATLSAGGATLRVVASAGALTVSDTLDVPFLPSGPTERVVQKIKLAPGKLDLATLSALQGWAPTSEKAQFWITNNPYADSFQNLDYLVHYPYGCIEQTASTIRPLLYVADLAEQVDPQLANVKIEDMVIGGINRILSMETPSGGFGYWPGADTPLEWATAYATDTLLDAKKAGYAVPDDRLAEVIGWIEGRVAAYERGERIIHAPWNHYDEQAEAYLHYVLARAGKGKKARILKLLGDIPANGNLEQAEDRYLLEAALYLAGDRRFEAQLEQVDASPIHNERINDWSFFSDRRRRGEMLSVFFDLFGADPAGAPLADRVAETLRDEPGYYYTTQELVWGITGLGKWVKATAGKGTAGGTLTADGQVITPRGQKTPSNERTWSLQRAAEYKALALDVPASANGMWLVIASEGVRPNAPYKVGGAGLSVLHSYHLLDSTEIQPGLGTVHLGDLLVVEVNIENTSDQVIQNIALVDRLPAGYEIENPRLGRSAKPDWINDEDLWSVDFMNLRDDRLEAFGTLGPHEEKRLVYTVRAVTAGTFAIPPVEAGAMYDPTLWARAAAQTAVIGGPWTGKLL